MKRHAARLLAPLTICALGLGLATGGSAAPKPVSSADLRITKTDAPDPVTVGAPLTYALQVGNSGPAAATGVTVVDTLPKGVDFVSAAAPGGQCSLQGRKVTCGVQLPAAVGADYGGSVATVTIVVIPRQAGTIRNTASVKGAEKDPVGKNNSATTTTRVIGGATCRGVAATVVGTPAGEKLVGTAGPDVIAALGGDDTIVSSSGRDLICAGGGGDVVTSGTAADKVFGGAGRDRLVGRGGADLLRGQAGRDSLLGGPGVDRLRGGGGSDRCRGGAGGDSLQSCER